MWRILVHFLYIVHDLPRELNLNVDGLRVGPIQTPHSRPLIFPTWLFNEPKDDNLNDTSRVSVSSATDQGVLPIQEEEFRRVRDHRRLMGQPNSRKSVALALWSPR